MSVHLSRQSGAAALVAALALVAAPAAVADVTFRSLGTLDPSYFSYPSAISPDGAVVVGTGGVSMPGIGQVDRPVRWLGAEIEIIPGPDGDPMGRGWARGASAGGAVIVGEVWNAAGTETRAFRTVGHQTELLPTLPGYTSSEAFDVTPDGARIVGSSGGRPVMWHGDGVPTLLSGPDTRGRAIGVSADGTRAVVTAQAGGVAVSTAYLWRSEGGTQVLSVPPTHVRNASVAISDDGSTVLHQAMRMSDERGESFVWTEATGSVLLPAAPGAAWTEVNALSADGSTIVGSSGGAVIWQDGEVIILRDLLTANGVDLTGWTLFGATAVSADGLTIAGWGRHGFERRAWVATIPGPGGAGTALLGGLWLVRRRRRPA